jgi:hypothetical protein
MRRSLAFGMALSFGLCLALEARAAEPGGTPPPRQAEYSVTPAGLLAAADAAVGAGDVELARSLFGRLAAQFPGSPEASEARRALAIIALRISPAARPVAPFLAPSAAVNAATEDGDVVVRDEPY